MSSISNQIKQQFHSGSMNLKLIMVNIGIFVLTLLITVLVKLFASNFSLLYFLSAPSDFGTLLVKPWAIITYMFSHTIDGIGHLFWNMFLLYFAGNFFQAQLGGRKLLSTYFLGGLAGFALFFIGDNYFPTLASSGNENLVGASAAVTAIFVAIGVYMPNYEVKLLFIPQSFKLIYIVLFFILLDFIRLQTSIGDSEGNTEGLLSHIGGAIYGTIYALKLKNGRNIASWFEKIVDNIVTLFKQKPTLIIKRTSKSKQQSVKSRVPRDDYEYNAQIVNNQKKIDAILDKISKSGYESLSKTEKDFLFKQSKK